MTTEQTSHRLWHLSALPFLLIPVVSSAGQPPGPGALALTHVTVIDMTGAPPKPDRTVVIRGNRIMSVDRAARARVPADAQILDGSGKFLIPGLWDMHVHFSDPRTTLPLFVANGVTGIRNMGGELETSSRWRAAVASGEIQGPRMIACGPIVDGPEPAAHGPTIVVGTPAEGRETVNLLKRGGMDCIKVYDRLPRAAYFAIVDEARKRALPVVGHVPLSVTSREAADAGQASIEHLGSILEGTSTLEAELHRMESSNEPVKDPSEFPRRIAARGGRMLDTYDNGKAARLFAAFVRHRTWQVPTLEFKWAQTFIDDLSAQGDARLKYIPPSDREWWSPEKNFFARYRTPEYIVFRKRLFQRELDLVGAMHRAGVPFMTGTDLSGAYVFAGFSLHHELQLFVQAGFTAMEALQAATRNPAIFLGARSSQGTVEKGKLADLVLLDANPLDDIRNTQRINAVVLNGKYLSKEVLQGLLADAEAAASRTPAAR